MLTEKEALDICLKKKNKKPYSCALLPDKYVFVMTKTGTEYWAVDKKTGTLYAYTPAFELIAFSSAPYHVL